MRLFRRGQVYYAHVYENGERRQISTRCRDKKAAELRARVLEREAADPAGAAAAKTTIEDALALLLEDRAERARAGRRSHETVACYRRKAGHWLRVFGRLCRLRDVDAAAVDRYISQRRAEGAQDSTIHKELVVMRAALKLALRRGLWVGDPCAVLPVAFSPAYVPRARALSRAELLRLLPVLTPDHAARVAFIVATSACWGESERACRADVHAGEVEIRGTKTATRARTVPVVTRWQQDLLAYALKHAAGEEGLLFASWLNVRRDLRAACKRLGIAPCSPNDLRRTHGRWLRAEGVPPHVIGLVMGHADGRMAERVYARPKGAELGALVSAELHRSHARGRGELAEALREAAATAVGHAPDEDVAAVLRVSRLLTTEASAQQTGALLMDPLDSSDSQPPDFQALLVPRDGIEPPTRGFSSAAMLIGNPRESKRTTRERGATEAPVQRRRAAR